jgi:hypothetical protein
MQIAVKKVKQGVFVLLNAVHNHPVGWIKLFFNERFIAPINIKTYIIVTTLFLNYNQFTTVS